MAGKVELVACALLCSFAGCRSAEVPGRAAVLKASRAPYEPDIPLPQDFVLVEESCEDWASGPIRYLRHRYHGWADRLAVRRFYREQMPLVRWTPVGDGSIRGRCTMRFERGTESCTISIEDLVGRRPGRVNVDVLITPKGP